MKFRKFLPVLFVSAAALIMASCDSKGFPKMSDKKEDFHVYLFVGGDNMSGRGIIAPDDKEPEDAHIVMLDKNGQWVPAVEPVQYDSPEAAKGPALEFCRNAVYDFPTCKIGIIPAACSGSLISEWSKGATCKKSGTKPFDNAIELAKKAQAEGTLKCIVWAQGENETSGSGYGEKLQRLMESFRKELNAPNLPFVVSEILVDPMKKVQEDINKGIRDVANSDEKAEYSSCREMLVGPDKIHFDAMGASMMGGRLYGAYYSIIENDPFSNMPAMEEK